MTNSWKLQLGDEILGILTDGVSDMPLEFCEFAPNPSFAPYQALFEEELALLNSDRMDLWERAYSEIESLRLVLKPFDLETEPITKFILHIDGNKAWFRS